jgi:hypothetical protein
MTHNPPHDTPLSDITTPLRPEDEPELTPVDRNTLDEAQQAAMPPDSNAEPEFQAVPPPSGAASGERDEGPDDEPDDEDGAR